ncbi:hypothetical protein KQX54_017362 [Cotesia glomerata]|uniref:Uncharacterized protein n=1 Tax=Cotesia glomerata TaxID=32391 RepID=A0AAV7I3I8_COTGL|nr:hypothetical protein KQX54_017362 [Cotesia glomerata]
MHSAVGIRQDRQPVQPKAVPSVIIVENNRVTLSLGCVEIPEVIFESLRGSRECEILHGRRGRKDSAGIRRVLKKIK